MAVTCQIRASAREYLDIAEMQVDRVRFVEWLFCTCGHSRYGVSCKDIKDVSLSLCIKIRIQGMYLVFLWASGAAGLNYFDMLLPNAYTARTSYLNPEAR